MPHRLLILLLLLWSLPAAVAAGDDTAPPQLSAWKQWVLDAQEREARCPFRADGDRLVRQCVWAENLALDITSLGLDFELRVETEGRGWVQLPGSPRHWPATVAIDGVAAPVVAGAGEDKQREAYPGTLLEAGRHRLKGHIPLDPDVQSIPLPPHRGLVQLSMQGRQLDTVDIDRHNVLWLKRSSAQGTTDGTGDTLRVKVFRKLTDAIPITLETRLELAVSGRAREVALGRLLPEGAVVTYFQSPLPARIEADGQLKIQVRAGNWSVVTVARYQQAASRFSFERRGEPWPQAELWAFEAQPRLRSVKITGADSIDPSQLSGPPEWRRLPTYRLAAEQALQVEELFRGEVKPPANTLAVQRTLWLDFDRDEATVSDVSTGTMASGWRLSAADDVDLGRAAVNGIPQVITELADGSEGVEVRDATFRLETVSRLIDARTFSASGWRQDVDSLSANLYLPPGWQLWHASGPDLVRDSWLSRWDLWDIFVCLLVVVTTARLLSKRWAGVAALLLALVYHEALPAVATASVLLFALAFLRALPPHRLRRLVLGVCYTLGLLLVATLLTFFVDAVRQAIYPQLEYHHAINYGPTPAADAVGMDDAPTVPVAAEATFSRLEKTSRQIAAGSAPPPAPRYRAEPEKIQTGPGLPTWQWHSTQLYWSGPVTAQQQVALYLSPPPFTRLLRLIQVLLMGAFGGRILSLLWQLRSPGAGDGRDAPAPALASATAVLLVLTGAMTPPDAQAEGVFPPQYLLKDYARRLLQAPDCGSRCYAINAAHLEATQDSLDLLLTISVVERIGVPLPRFSPSWQLSAIRIGDAPAQQLFQHEGQWFVLLGPGVHDVQLRGRLVGEEFKLDFPEAHNITVEAPGWEVTGLAGNRLQNKSLTLSRQLASQQRDTLFPDPIAPHIAVHRRLVLDQDWLVETTVRRLAPAQGSIQMRVPLLEGEHIQTEGFESQQGMVAVSLPGGQQQAGWQSTLEPSAEYRLVNRSGPAIAEHWSIAASPRWRIETSGLAPVKPDSTGPDGLAAQHWRPWPEEVLTLQATRPRPAQGATATVEAARWHYTPGERSSLAQLSLSIRSSIGQDYAITPPPGAVLEALEVDGQERALPAAEGPLTAALHPGLQQLTARWRMESGAASTLRSPPLALASPANNIDLEIELPRDRWPLAVGGPAMGPAMLFWGVLIVLLFVAGVLSLLIRRQRLSIPLKTWHWVLLIIGMSTVNAVGSLWIVAWFFVLEARGRMEPPARRWQFNLLQLGIAALTVISAVVLLGTIPQSLLSFPDMQVQGNGSSNYLYRWYQDHSEGALPAAWVFSVPIMVYRAVMLLWSLWLVFALMRWVRWAWARFSHRGLWATRQSPPQDNSAADAGHGE